MYHVELRQFPHNLNRFNLDERELRAIVLPWAREQVVELGERKWSPHQARLTVLEGPRLGVEQLSMGRGWRAAQRESDDVTERVLAAAAEAIAAAAAPPAGDLSAQSPPAAGLPVGDPFALGVQLASLLGPDPAGLLAAWREVTADAPGLPPSETLALAERRLAAPGAGPG
jgi:hypothetical protein